MPKLLIIRGLSGSGKSTLAKWKVSTGEYSAYFEADQYFEKDGEYLFDPSQLGDAHNWCYLRVFDYLSRGESVIVANTFSRIWEMQKYLNMKDLGYEIEVLTCTGDYGNIHNVPEKTIMKMKARWEDYEEEQFV